MTEFTLAPLDIVMVAIYVVFIIAIGFYFARRTKSETDYFLAGRSLTWWLIGFSLLASNLSSSSLMGMASEAYSRGIAVYNYEWMAGIILVIFALFFLPFYLKTRIFTMPEFLEKRFDERSRYWFSGITILGNIIIDVAAALYAGALVIEIIYPGTPMWLSVSALALLAGLYTVAGGLAAVVYTDAIQAVLLLIGSTLISVIAFTKLGGMEAGMGAWDIVTRDTPPEMLSVIRPIDDPVMPWPGLLTGVFLLGFYFWTNNQFMAQRVLGAKSVDHGRWGAIFAGFLKLPIIFIMVLPGTFARTLYPGLENPDLAFPTMMFDLLPVGVRGLIMVALVAAIMSSVDSTLNSASTLVTMDFVKKLRPNADKKTLLWTGRITTFIFMVFAAAWAPQVVKFPSIWQYLQQVLAYLAPPVVACFVFGVFWWRSNRHGAFWGLVGGHLVALGSFIASELNGAFILQSGPLNAEQMALVAEGTPVLHFLYLPPILFSISALIIIVVSLATEAPKEEQYGELTMSRKFLAAQTKELEGVVWYKNYRILSAILLVATAVFVFMFR